jgi:hypothetical protein
MKHYVRKILIDKGLLAAIVVYLTFSLNKIAKNKEQGNAFRNKIMKLKCQSKLTALNR